MKNTNNYHYTMDTLVIQKYPRFNDELTFDDIVDIEAMFDNEACGDKSDIDYDKEIIEFYKPFYTTYKTEKYWYNPMDNKPSTYGNTASLRENLFLGKLPCGVIDWLEKHSDGDMYSYCVLTKKILEDLLELCKEIGFDAMSAGKIFPSDIDRYDTLYFQNLFKLSVTLPHIIAETDFEKYQLICNII